MPEATPQSGAGLKLLLKGTTWQAVGQLLPLVINLVLTPYIIHGLGKPIYGIFLLINVIQVFMAGFDGGIGPSASRYFTLYAGVDDRASTTRLLTTLLAIVSCSATLVFALFFVATPSIVDFFGKVTRYDPDGASFLLRTMVVLVAVAQLRGLFAAVLFAQHKFAVTTTTGLVGHLIYVIGLVWTIEGHHGLRGIAFTFIAQQMMATLTIIPSALQHLHREGLGFVSGSTLKEFFRYSWKVQFSSLLDLVSLQGDMLIVSKLAAAQQPYFGPGANFAQQLRMVPMNAFAPVQAMLGRAVAAKGFDGAMVDYARIQKLWVAGVVGWCSVGAPAAYFGVTRWLHMGSNLPGIVCAVLLIGHMFYLIGVIQVLWCLAVGRSGLELRYGLVSTTLNIVLTLALVVPFGVEGTITATMTAQLVASLVLTRLMHRHLTPKPPSPWRHAPWDVAALGASLSYLGVYLVQPLIGTVVPEGGLALILCGLAAAPAAVVYAVLVIGPTQLRGAVAGFVRSRRGLEG